MSCNENSVIQIKIQSVNERCAYHEVSYGRQQFPVAVGTIFCQKQNHQYNKQADKPGKYICEKEHFADHMMNLTLLNIQDILGLRYSNVNVLMRDRTDVQANKDNVLILPGSDIWSESENFQVLEIAKRLLEAGGLVAAICGAAVARANNGLLDDKMHTLCMKIYRR